MIDGPIRQPVAANDSARGEVEGVSWAGPRGRKERGVGPTSGTTDGDGPLPHVGKSRDADVLQSVVRQAVVLNRQGFGGQLIAMERTTRMQASTQKES